MTYPGDSGVNQRACYSGQNCSNYPIYQTVKMADWLIFHMLGPETRRSYEITVHRKKEVENVLK